MIDLSPTYLQYINFIKIFLFGFLPAILVSIIHFFRLIFKNKFIPNLIFDIFICLFTTLLFLILVNKLNFGETRFYLIFSYLLGFILFLKTIGKLFAKLNKIVYTKLSNLTNKFANTKLGKVLNK